MRSVPTSFSTAKWRFWIDRGGTFTDIVATSPQGEVQTAKFLSENPEVYDDAALYGIRQFLGVRADAPIPADSIEVVKMGTTVATNALLERKGDRTVLAVTKGFRDVVEIGYQARPKTFALKIEKPHLLYEAVIEIDERFYESGEVETPLNLEAARRDLQKAYNQGFRSIAIALMHAYKHPDHEKQLIALAKEIGFLQVSASHDVSPLAKIVSRGEATVVDAYLTPILRRYVDKVADAVSGDWEAGRLLFMQSSGGLIDAAKFRGRDAILSGPAGGVGGCVHTAKIAGFDKVLGFDMGGTSTDVSHYADAFEKVYETEVAGVRMRAPMMHIHTVAAGGGSLLKYDGERFRVGPDSAGAAPGPVSYRRGGALAVTDANVCVGKLPPDHFPKIFGPNQDQALDHKAAYAAFAEIAKDIGDGRSAENVAEGFLDIAVEHMAQAIKKISISRGYDVKDYVLNCFGGAGGQHACLVAERLGVRKILLHPFAGVLSAYGMGLADVQTERQVVVDKPLAPGHIDEVETRAAELVAKNAADLQEQGIAASAVSYTISVLMRYKGTDTTISVAFADPVSMQSAFEKSHKRQFGFVAPDKAIMLDTLVVSSSGGGERKDEKYTEEKSSGPLVPVDNTQIYTKGEWRNTPIYRIEQLQYGHSIAGPAIIIEPTSTIVVEPGWMALMNKYRHLILSQTDLETKRDIGSGECDPVRLEIFNNLFMSIAEQMGIVLRNTSQSVNVRERLDFSCAIFDRNGSLVANAPHVPVHLGSMDSSVQVIINSGQEIRPGDAFVQNNPYNGGSHLPDVTVVSPVFDGDEKEILFYVASRAHHEDIGGVAPGSMSPLAKTIQEEGVILDNLKCVENGVFLIEDVRAALTEGPYPARNIDQNIADLMAQAAANTAGAVELRKLVDAYGRDTVHAYMGYIQQTAEEAVRRVIDRITDGGFEYKMDGGGKICVRVLTDRDKREAVIDFSGTSPQKENNLNAPAAITRAAVLYVFRCLVDDDIPLNAGCMTPIKIITPEGSLLNPRFPAAVVAGNVETSQAITNALFAALGTLGTSQGTMNNLTFGNDRYQYYETICSGAPAGPGFDGAAAVHTHMTNTRMTDPEILEHRYPVLLEEFSIVRNSGGRGKWRAGDGVVRSIRFLEDMECSILSGHREIAPYGISGGEAGRVGRNWIERREGLVETLKGSDHVKVSAGDKINIRTPTGGGFGAAE